MWSFDLNVTLAVRAVTVLGNVFASGPCFHTVPLCIRVFLNRVAPTSQSSYLGRGSQSSQSKRPPCPGWTRTTSTSIVLGVTVTTIKFTKVVKCHTNDPRELLHFHEIVSERVGGSSFHPCIHSCFMFRQICRPVRFFLFIIQDGGRSGDGILNIISNSFHLLGRKPQQILIFFQLQEMIKLKY